MKSSNEKRIEHKIQEIESIEFDYVRGNSHFGLYKCKAVPI